MRNRYQRFSCTDGVQRLRYLSLRYAVEVGGCFVENHDWRVLQEHAGNGDALPFAAAEFHAVLSAPFVELCGKAAKSGGGKRSFQCIVVRLWRSESQVFADGFCKQVGFL